MEKWEQELFILRRKLDWFIDGIGRHCMTWNQFKHLTPEWIVKHYNVEIPYFKLNNIEDWEKEFTPYNTALRMKAIGFDEPCFGHYQQEWHDDGMTELEPSLQMIISKQHQHAYQLCTAPTYSQAFRWFRDRYGLWFRPDYYGELSEYNFQGSIHELGKYSAVADIGNHKTPEEAELASLITLIEIVENI